MPQDPQIVQPNPHPRFHGALPFRGLADFIDNSFDSRIVKGYLTTLYVAYRR